MGWRRRRRQNLKRTDAIIHTIANPRLIRPILIRQPMLLVEDEDRRRHHPLGMFAPAKVIGGNPARIVVKKSAPAKPARSFSSWFPPASVQFDAPKKTLVCIRRNMRKEVLHALRKTGRGGGRRRKPRRNWYSAISC